ncbi:uncharacterized protein [Bemisia tabaci]
MDDSKKECRTPRQPNNLQESIPEVASGVKCEADPPDNIPEAIQTVFIKCEVPESDPEPTSDTESPEFGAQNVNRGTGPSSCEGSALLEQPQAGSAEAAGISTEVERSDQRAGSLEVKSDSDEKVAPRNISNAPLNEGPAVSTKRTRGSKEPLNCSYCSRSFQLKTLLSRHLRTHTEEKRFRCSQCPAAFAEKSRLHQHTLIHTNEKPFRCRHCPASFALLLRDVETARSTSRWDTARNLMRQVSRVFSTGSRSSRSRSLSSNGSASSGIWRLLSGRRNSDEPIPRQRARSRRTSINSTPRRHFYATVDGSAFGNQRSAPWSTSSQRVCTYDWMGDIYYITETHFTDETYNRIQEEAQRNARTRMRIRDEESQPMVLVRTRVVQGTTRKFVFVRREVAHLDFLPADGSVPWLTDMFQALNRARIAAGLPPQIENPRFAPSPPRSPKRDEVHPKDEEAPDTDDENETGSSCKICMDRKIKLALIPCNHEICYTCTQTISGRRIIDENQPVRSFNCPSVVNQ